MSLNILYTLQLISSYEYLFFDCHILHHNRKFLYLIKVDLPRVQLWVDGNQMLLIEYFLYFIDDDYFLFVKEYYLDVNGEIAMHSIK